MKSQTPEAEGVFLSHLSLIFTVSFTNNMSKPDWTWKNLWNFLLTINSNHKYFNNSVDLSGLYLQVYIPSCFQKNSRLYTVFRLLGNAFVKLSHPWKDLIINSPCRKAPKICPPSVMKSIYKKVPPCFGGNMHYALAPLKNHVGVYASSIFARKCGLKLVNILILAKRTVWQNRSVG